MAPLPRILAFGLLVMLLPLGHAQDAPDWLESESQALVESYQAGETFPLVSTRVDDLDVEGAYDLQEAFVEGLEEAGATRTGYKLGLTGDTRPFGAEEPVYGRLLEDMQLSPGATLNLSDFADARLEVELALILGEDVPAAASAAAIEAAIESVAPAIEVPDFAFDTDEISWLDLIAYNVAAKRYIMGEPVALDDLEGDLDDIATVARLDGEVINEAPADATMGGQILALEFLVDKLAERGEMLRQGDVVITGALGPLLPAEPGAYEVEYGPLGSIEFSVEQ